jgi:hypothetical protein
MADIITSLLRSVRLPVMVSLWTISANSVFSVEAHPKGYPRLAALINSDVDYVMFREFGNLHVRSLLYKQAELTDLEDELEELDKADAEEPTSVWKLSSHINLPNADNGIRKALMDKIDVKMKEYGMLCPNSANRVAEADF